MNFIEEIKQFQKEIDSQRCLYKQEEDLRIQNFILNNLKYVKFIHNKFISKLESEDFELPNSLELNSQESENIYFKYFTVIDGCLIQILNGFRIKSFDSKTLELFIKKYNIQVIN